MGRRISGTIILSGKQASRLLDQRKRFQEKWGPRISNHLIWVVLRSTAKAVCTGFTFFRPGRKIGHENYCSDQRYLWSELPHGALACVTAVQVTDSRLNLQFLP